MQDLGYELPRIPLPRTPMNKGMKKGQGIRPGLAMGPRRLLFGGGVPRTVNHLRGCRRTLLGASSLSAWGYALDTAGSCSMPSHSQRFRIWKKANTTMTTTFSIEEVHSRTM
jgi:hypothetical protein